MGRIREMTSQIHRIWMTAEVDAWSRGFDYADYIDLRQKRGDTSAPLSERGYKSLCDLLRTEMTQEFEADEALDHELQAFQLACPALTHKRNSLGVFQSAKTALAWAVWCKARNYE